MRTPKNSPAVPQKRNYTRKAVKKAIEIQDQENVLTPQEIQDAIRVKAYEIFLDRGGHGGNAEQDWVEAEKIILSKFQ